MEEIDDGLANDLNEARENCKREENMDDKLDNCDRNNNSDKWEPPSVYKHLSNGVQWEATVETRMYCGNDSDEESEKEDEVQTCHLESCERNKMIKYEKEDLNSSLINVDENLETGEAKVCIDKTGRKNKFNIPAYFKDILVLVLFISIVSHFIPYSVINNGNHNFKVKTDFWLNSSKNEPWNMETGITGMKSMTGAKAYAYYRYDEVHKRAKTEPDATHDVALSNAKFQTSNSADNKIKANGIYNTSSASLDKEICFDDESVGNEIKAFGNESSDIYKFAVLKSLDESRILYEISTAATASEMSMCTAEQGKHGEYVQGNKTNENCLYSKKSKYILRHNVKNMNGNINGMPRRLKTTIHTKKYLKDWENGTDVCITHKMLDFDKTDSFIDIRSLPEKCIISQIHQWTAYHNLATETCHITEDPASKVLDSKVYCGIEGDKENTTLRYNSHVELDIENIWCSKVTIDLEIERETHPSHLDDVKFQKDNMISRYLKCTNKENENNGKKTTKSWQICIVIIIIIMLVTIIICSCPHCLTRYKGMEASENSNNKFFTNPEKNIRKRCFTRTENSTKRTENASRCSPGDSCNEDVLGASSGLSDSTLEYIDGSKSGHFKSDAEKTDMTYVNTNNDVGTHMGSFHSKDLDRYAGHSAGDTDNASCTNGEPLTEIHENDENALSSRVGNSSGNAKNVDNVNDTRKNTKTDNPICVHNGIVTNTGHVTGGNVNVNSANSSMRYACDRLLGRHVSSASNEEIRPLTNCRADKTDSHSTSSARANIVISVNDYTEKVCYGDKGKLMLYIRMLKMEGIPNGHHGTIINDCITVEDGCIVQNETYYIDKKIGSGSYGTVYECTDRNGTKFALKMVDYFPVLLFKFHIFRLIC